MVTGNATIATIESIDGLSDPIVSSPTTQELNPAGATTSHERRKLIAQGKDPNTGQPLSLQEHHYKLIMMNASDKEWEAYHERLRQMYAR